MKYLLRKVKNSSGNVSVQVGYYFNRRFKLLKHIGSAKNDNELLYLLKSATELVNNHNLKSFQLPLFKTSEQDLSRLFLQNYIPQKITYKFALSEIEKYFSKIGYNQIKNNLLKYLAIIRLINPTSKRESLNLLLKYFDIKYSESYLYKTFKRFQKQKMFVEKLNTAFAQNTLKQNLSILFYDVTTLYFESFTADDLKTIGFSKDNKFNQPQILVGLIISDIGFPIAYNMFQGKKFEGKTMIPAIKKYIEKIGGNITTIVADAGIISEDNILSLKQINWTYIVGARLSNLKSNLYSQITQHNFQKNFNLEINTDLGRLIIEFSTVRFKKDEHELDKAISKATNLLKSPSKIDSKYKLIKKDSGKYSLNQALIDKKRSLLGLKGYYSNTDYTIEKIISEYKNLWKIEQNFRVFKGDLATRPIYHWKPENIQSHLLISFMALSIAKLIEIETKSSIHNFVDIIMEKKDLELIDVHSNQKFSVRI